MFPSIVPCPSAELHALSGDTYPSMRYHVPSSFPSCSAGLHAHSCNQAPCTKPYHRAVPYSFDRSLSLNRSSLLSHMPCIPP